jgi:hypothetical protein
MFDDEPLHVTKRTEIAAQTNGPTPQPRRRDALHSPGLWNRLLPLRFRRIAAHAPPLPPPNGNLGSNRRRS